MPGGGPQAPVLYVAVYVVAIAGAIVPWVCAPPSDQLQNP
jgi:hypothetical protein